ncbi:hypothetical protein HYW40_00740 [Candidatus Curtissbacteria bacterium]|nr:hypothetical protein [Candidatus Curtissbacteria bacterium]
MPSGGRPHQFDRSNLRQMILDSPKQFAVGFDIAEGVKVDGKFERVVFSGEGGSAFPSQLLETIVSEFAGAKAPQIITNHSYSLPAVSTAGALNVVCSYSGNTEETISNLEEAISKKLPVIGIASGGKVEEICKASNIPFVKLPMPSPEFQPRMGTGYFVAAMVKLLENHGLVSGLSDEMGKNMGTVGEGLEEVERKGMELAGKIAGKTPVVYSSEKFARLAMVWKIKFNEHAKNPAFWNFFSELNHNEMVGFTNLGERYFAVMLKDPQDDPRNLKRYDVMAKLVGEKGLESVMFGLEGKNAFEKIFKSLLLADFTAYYLAMYNKADPTPVEMVEHFKKLLVG